MRLAKGSLCEARIPYSSVGKLRRAVGYIRVSTDMQATEGLSLEAQQAAIERYCTVYGLKLVAIYKDILSGSKPQRPGLRAALTELRNTADVLIVFRFDRLSRSLKHFCELYEQYFKTGDKELVAIREAIRLDSWQGRALVNVLFVFAQMESEATSERTRTAVAHIRSQGYHFGKVRYGQQAIPAPNNPRYRILIEHPDEQRVLAQLRVWGGQGVSMNEMAARLNATGVRPPQGEQWTKHNIYGLKLRLTGELPRPVTPRWHTAEELEERIVSLIERGHTQKQVASILNEERWGPPRGRKFTESRVGRILRSIDPSSVLHPRKFLELRMERMERVHASEHPEEPFMRPGYPRLARLLTEAGFLTPKGHEHWWPAQAQQLLKGQYEKYYSAREHHPLGRAAA